MRELSGHKVNPVNDKLVVLAEDELGPGGAPHHYEIQIPLPQDPGEVGKIPQSARTIDIDFQKGPIAEVGVNGLTQEALIAVIIDRFEHFQRGQFANGYNARALEHLQAAQSALLDRTKDRVRRGVEGYNRT